MRWVISDSCSLVESGVSGLEEMSSSRERRVKAAFSEGSILSSLSERFPCRLGWLARASLPRCLAEHHFYSAKKDRRLH